MSVVSELLNRIKIVCENKNELQQAKIVFQTNFLLFRKYWILFNLINGEKNDRKSCFKFYYCSKK